MENPPHTEQQPSLTPEEIKADIEQLIPQDGHWTIATYDEKWFPVDIRKSFTEPKPLGTFTNYSSGKGVSTKYNTDEEVQALYKEAHAAILLQVTSALRTPRKTAWEKGTVPVLLSGLHKRGTVPRGFVRGSNEEEMLEPTNVAVMNSRRPTLLLAAFVSCVLRRRLSTFAATTTRGGTRFLNSDDQRAI